MIFRIVRFQLCLLLFAALLIPKPGYGGMLTSDPLWDWKYDAVERLVSSYGFSGIYLSNMRPVSRAELAKVVSGLINKHKSGEGARAGGWHYDVLLERLKNNLSSELGQLNIGGIPEKRSPLQWIRVKGETSDYPAFIYNDYGYKAQSSGFKTMAGLSWEQERFALELRPELDYFSHSGLAANLHSGFAVGRFGNLEVQAGKDSMWWGPGRNGTNMLTNNAPAFNMVKMQTAEPVDLWLLGATKILFFIGETGVQKVSMKVGNAAQYADYVETRNPIFTGLRLDFAPFYFVEIAISHTIMATNRIGEQYQLGDLLQLIYPDWQANEDAGYRGLVSNHLQSVDLSLVFDNSHSLVHLTRLASFKFYVEYGGEAVYVQNHIWPYLQFPQLLTGIYLDWGSFDLRAEYLKNSTQVEWYKHYQMSSGYTNDGIIMGHHAGGYAKNLFLAISCAVNSHWVTRLGYEYTEHSKLWNETPVNSQETGKLGFDYFGSPLGEFKIDVEARSEWDGTRTMKNNLFIVEWVRRF